MEAMFEQTQRWIREEIDFWQGRMAKVVEQTTADVERFATSSRELLSKGLVEQDQILGEAVKRSFANAARQVDALKAAFDPARKD